MNAFVIKTSAFSAALQSTVKDNWITKQSWELLKKVYFHILFFFVLAD